MSRSFSQLAQTVRRWLTESDELLLSSHFSAGDSDYFLCRSEDDLVWFARNSGAEFPRQIEAYRGRPLPIRGRVTDELIRQACETIPDNTECLIVYLKPRIDRLMCGNFCENHSELIGELEDERGEAVGVGVLPGSGFDQADYDRESDDRGWEYCTLNAGTELD